MGLDVSVLVVPARLDLEVLEAKARRELRRGGGNVSLLLVDERTGPAGLAAQLPAYSALSVWGDEEGDGWDALAVALTQELGQRGLAFTVADHAAVGCWQVLEPGRAEDANWISGKGYRSAPVKGLAAAFGLELPEEGLAEGLSIAARGGLCLRSSASGVPAGPLAAEVAARIVADDVPGAEYACCLLAHGEEPRLA